jgi:hypothetical protein
MTKALSIFVVFAAILFFIGGGIAVWQGVLGVATYALVGGIVGSIASTIGLLAFASPRLTEKDVLSVESQLVQRLADATTSLNEYETKISENKEELQQLQRDRLEVELLVRQASVKVFLEEKLKRLAEEIEERVISDTTLTDWLIEHEKSIEKVKEIDGQIASSNRADLIREVIGDLQPSDKKLFVEVLGVKVDVSPILRLSEGLVEGIAKSMLR